MSVLQSLRKNARFLASGLGSAIVILLIWRAIDGSALIQPQSDLGILLGALAVAGYVVFRDMRDANGKSS